ncbi:MAG: hypothetical protein ABS81_04990 [Pseudonocardia sp. SCN 72-86]|nr:MAG: hypothetical protein ABS81_04990 [Pseudonocardia sp. SCN 72-86]
MSPAARVLVCLTCPRYGEPGEQGRWSAAVRERLPRDTGVVRYVRCLGACEAPGNAAIEGEEARVRMTGLEPEHIDLVVTACEEYRAGSPTVLEALPPELRERVSAVAPKRVTSRMGGRDAHAVPQRAGVRRDGKSVVPG